MDHSGKTWRRIRQGAVGLAAIGVMAATTGCVVVPVGGVGGPAVVAPLPLLPFLVAPAAVATPAVVVAPRPYGAWGWHRGYRPYWH